MFQTKRAYHGRRQQEQEPKPPFKWRGMLIAVGIVAVVLFVGYTLLFQGLSQKGEKPEYDGTLPEDSAEAEAMRSHLERKDDFYIILAAGVDDGNGGSDTIILTAVDAANDRIYGVSIPRDTKVIINGKDHKINYAYALGGMDMLSEVVSEQLGIPVDYTVQVDLQGFVALVDAIGGVTFDVPVDMDYEDPVQDLYIHIPKGVQTLNGEDALKVVRFRSGYASQDLGRMQTQQAFLKAAAKQLLTVSNLKNIDEFVKIFYTYVETDLTLGNLAWLGREALGMGMEAVEFSTLPNSWKSPYIYLDREATLTLVNERLNPYVEDRTAEDLNIPS